MTNDSPPESPRRASGGEFTWPPTREELDAIEVIRLDDPSSLEPIAGAVVPVKAKAIAVPAIGRRGRLRLPRREDFVFAGAVGTSVLAIAVAATMQFSDVLNSAFQPAARSVNADQAVLPARPGPPLSAEALPLISSIATAPAATFAAIRQAPASTPAPRHAADIRSRAKRHVPHRRALTPRAASYARPAPYARREGSDDYVRPRLIAPEGGRSGKLVLLVEVKKNGKVGDVDVLSSDLDRKNRSHRDLQRAAISTVKRWRYEPAIRSGAPADTQIRVVVNIDLDSSRVGFTEAAARRRAAAANRAADSVLAAR